MKSLDAIANLSREFRDDGETKFYALGHERLSKNQFLKSALDDNFTIYVVCGLVYLEMFVFLCSKVKK